MIVFQAKHDMIVLELHGRHKQRNQKSQELEGFNVNPNVPFSSFTETERVKAIANLFERSDFTTTMLQIST
jgi:hypothetical protein